MSTAVSSVESRWVNEHDSSAIHLPILRKIVEDGEKSACCNLLRDRKAFRIITANFSNRNHQRNGLAMNCQRFIYQFPTKKFVKKPSAEATDTKRDIHTYRGKGKNNVRPNICMILATSIREMLIQTENQMGSLSPVDVDSSAQYHAKKFRNKCVVIRPVDE